MDNRIRELATAGYVICPHDDKYIVATADTQWYFRTYQEAVDGAWKIFQKNSEPQEFTVTFRYDRGLGIEYASVQVIGNDPESKARKVFEAKMKSEPKFVINEVRVRPKLIDSKIASRRNT